MTKIENYELKNIKCFENLYKNEKNTKFGDTEIQKQTFHQQKRPISIKI